jgi:hypothetical protein
VTAIVVRPSPEEARRKHPDYGIDPADWMPLATRLKVAREINRAWEEFVNDMHDGSTSGPEVAEKFWRFVTGTS